MHVCVCLTGPTPLVCFDGKAGPYHLVLSSITLVARPSVVHVSKNGHDFWVRGEGEGSKSQGDLSRGRRGFPRRNSI